MILIFDTETTGLPRDFNAPISDSENWPRMVQIAWQLHTADGTLIEAKNYLVKPEGFTIPFNATKIHGISTQKAEEEGLPLVEVLEKFQNAVQKSTVFGGHNLKFDLNIIGAEYFRKDFESNLTQFDVLDTMEGSVQFCALAGGKGGKFKFPNLGELHEKLFGVVFAEAHNAAADVEATTRCFFELIKLKVLQHKTINLRNDISEYLVEIAPKILETIQERSIIEQANEILKQADSKSVNLNDINFAHLHTHSQFSLLPSTSEIKSLVKQAVKENMPAIAVTDHGNMYGAFLFFDQVDKENETIKDHNLKVEAGEIVEPKKELFKGIIGGEFYLCRDHKNKSIKDNGYYQVLIAKNKNGYQNLAKLSSISFIDGMYYFPRIDKEVLVQYKTDLIATTGALTGEIPSLILNVGETQALEAFLWWKEQFGDDFYVEINRHGLPEEDYVNKILIEWAKQFNVKYFASNNTYYTKKEDAVSHDILLCVKDGALKDTPVGKGRDFRFGFPNNEFYFKSKNEMFDLFSDIPEALHNTIDIVNKCEHYKLSREVLLPKFDIPTEFEDPKDKEDGGKRGENNYLRHLTYEGAKKRYKEISDEIKTRLDFELLTIEKSGYPGYFLIVQDFTGKAREMGVSVGPGRGSAAGSAVAYCIGITNVDPIKYDLLFERFLNPDRVSLPDIDIDFDDRGRGKVMSYVIEKYGKNQVAQIVTYGTMAAKSAIRDVSRVLQLPLSEADRLAKSYPASAKNLKQILLPEFISTELKESLKPEDLPKVDELRRLFRGDDLTAEVLKQATKLEGSLRSTGTHACGVIITPDDITKFVPVKSAEDAEISIVTQFDNSVAEKAGLLKMDFLGLNTLTLRDDAINLVKQTKGIKIEPDDIPLDDPKTYELFQRGETVGIFQYESPGMQKHMKDLKPDSFGDLIAMNALYRPGPIKYIPNFINRKHGREPITYDINDMEEYLKETYGITVYQEQVMLLSQSLAGFTKGEADMLRKAMGKKDRKTLDKMKPKFVEGCKAKGYDLEVVEKVWVDWEAFASYAFNKSHSTCYAYLAFQTAYLKANHPAEFMASVLSQNMSDIKQITFFIKECKRMKINVNGPDVNESYSNFSVNKKGEIRFALTAIKGVGNNAVDLIVLEREKNGPFSSIFDFVRRVDSKAVNKKTIENLALAGAFDSLNISREQLFFDNNGNSTVYLEMLIKFGNAFKENKENSQASLFGDSAEIEVSEPPLPKAPEWSTIEKLNKEKDVVGIFLTGHPLDAYKFELENFCDISAAELAINETKPSEREYKIGGILTEVAHLTTKTGNPFGRITLEDYTGSCQFFLFGDDYFKFKNYLENQNMVLIRGKIAYRVKWVEGKKVNDESSFEFKIRSIQSLDEIKKEVNGATFQIPIASVTEILVDQIQTMFEQNQGMCKVKLEIADFEENYSVTLSPKATINLNEVFLENLSSTMSLNYFVDKKSENKDGIKIVFSLIQSENEDNLTEIGEDISMDLELVED